MLGFRAGTKDQKISDEDPLFQQVKIMTESGDQKYDWQDNFCTDEVSSEERFLSDENKIVNKNVHPPCKTEDGKQHYVVAGAGFEPATFGL